ncbi:MAG: 7-cyano-7-deazaguanine synthase QueC [Methermicoccaceae archaeon]
MQDAVVLLSGGLDSLVCMAMAAREHDVLALTFDYGQMAKKSELAAATSIARHFGASHTVIELDFLKGGALTGEGVLPEPEMSELSGTAAHSSARAVWVPARNLVFCSVAVSIAERIGAHTVFIGANAEEGETFPDNTERFVESLNHTLRHATLHRVDVKAPVMGRTKSEIVKLGCELGVPFEFSWSCYRSLDVPCGRCESCMRRKRAFEKAGIHDPLEMRV